MAFTHGANDAQKTMGVIALALVRGRIDHFYIPTWVKIAAGSAIAAGTYFGGWRNRTVGQRLYQMDPAGGFASQATAGFVIFASTSRLSALDDACDLGRGDRLGGDEAALGRALGRRRQHRLRLDPDHPGRGDCRRRVTGRVAVIFDDAVRRRAGQCGDVRAAPPGGRERGRSRARGRAALPRAPVIGRVAGRRQGARARGRPVASELFRCIEAQFVTPYDREDLIELAFAIDEVPDKIENASELLGLYGVESPTRQSLELCALLVRATRSSRRCSAG